MIALWSRRDSEEEGKKPRTYISEEALGRPRRQRGERTLEEGSDVR